MRATVFQYPKPARSRAGFSFVALACALSLSPLHAQVRQSSDYLARMDTDGDGRVSLVEYQDWLSYAFDAMDANRDGVLDASERPARAHGAGPDVTREQHRRTLAERFAKQDRNRDGSLDARELAAPPQ